MNFTPAEKASTFRQPSTANLMIASQDRGNWSFTGLTNPFDFQITKTNSILNGFFTRIATSEIVLNWFQPNIYDATENPLGGIFGTNTFAVDISGGAHAGSHLVQLPSGFYTVKNVLDALVGALNDDTAPGVFSVSSLPSGTSIDISGGAQFEVSGASELPWMLGMIPYGAQNSPYATFHLVVNPDLRSVEYIDFISDQLTYNQELKDTSTNAIVKDVLARWYFAYDDPPSLDAYGFPILMGYTSFVLRRIFSPPKQIKWSPNQPVGNLAFYAWAQTTYSNNQNYGPLLLVDNPTNWLMTLQVSEV